MPAEPALFLDAADAEVTWITLWITEVDDELLGPEASDSEEDEHAEDSGEVD